MRSLTPLEQGDSLCNVKAKLIGVSATTPAVEGHVSFEMEPLKAGTKARWRLRCIRPSAGHGSFAFAP